MTLSNGDAFSLRPDFEPVDESHWRGLVDGDLKGASFEKRLVTRTYEGIDIQPLYSGAHVEQPDAAGFPGFAPQTRGSHPLGNVAGGWDVRQVQREAHPAAANAAILDDLKGGATSVLIELDTDGRGGGVRVDGLPALSRALRGVDTSAAAVALGGGRDALSAAALLVAHLSREQADAAAVSGALGVDPLGALARLGALDAPVASALSFAADAAAYCAERWPGLRAVAVDTSPYHDAGASSAQDLAIALATGVAYLRALESAGLAPEQAASQILFRLRIGCRFFMAIAKLRAARRLWGRVLEACGVPEAGRAMALEVRIGRRVLTRRDPWVNLLRNTVTCFAGALAGADAIVCEPLDAAIGPATALSRRLARNTQTVLQAESSLGRVVDPAGGAWMIEEWTEALSERAWSIFQTIESRGGLAAVLQSGWLAEQLAETAAERAGRIGRRRDPITGVSEFPLLDEAPPAGVTLGGGEAELAGGEPAPEMPGPSPAAALAAVAEAAAALTRGDAQAGALTSALVAAAEEGAAVGDLRRSLAGADGALVAPLPVRRYADAYEAMRDASDAKLAATGARPSVFLASLGRIAEHSARSMFARNLLEAGGLKALTSDGFESVEEAVRAFSESGAALAAICSSDARYQTDAAAAARALTAAGARAVVLAGRPGEHEPD